MLGQYPPATLIGLTKAPLAGGIIISSFMIYPGLIPYHMVYLVAALAAVPVLIMTFMYTDSYKISDDREYRETPRFSANIETVHENTRDLR